MYTRYVRTYVDVRNFLLVKSISYVANSYSAISCNSSNRDSLSFRIIKSGVINIQDDCFVLTLHSSPPISLYLLLHSRFNTDKNENRMRVTNNNKLRSRISLTRRGGGGGGIINC